MNGTYRGVWDDGATADITISTFTSTRFAARRVDFGKNQNFTAEYQGQVNGRTAAGGVTWNIQGTIASGSWVATW